MERLIRTEAVLGKSSVQILEKSFVVIVGLGGVGGYALEVLARSGVKNFRLVDYDTFDESNINRQILATQSTVGLNKTDVAECRIKEIDPNIKVEKLNLFIDESNMDIVLSDNPDIVVDAIDSISSKCFLIRKCVESNIKIVSSMGAALRKNPTSVCIDDLSKTFGCPLAKQIRINLKKEGITNGIKCVFSKERPLQREEMLGSISSVVGAFGFALGQLAIDELVNPSPSVS